MRATREPEILLAERGASVGAFGALVVAVTDGPDAFAPDVARRAVAAVAQLRRTSHKHRLNYAYLAGERSTLPSAEAREASAGVGDLIDSCMGIHEGSGFRASAVRAVVIGISMLSRSRVKVEVCSTVAEGAAVLSERYADLGSAAEIGAAIEAIRGAARATV